MATLEQRLSEEKRGLEDKVVTLERRLSEEKRSLEHKVATLEQQLTEAQSKVTEAGTAQPASDQSDTIVCAHLLVTSHFTDLYHKGRSGGRT